MDATLIINPNSANGAALSPDEISQALYNAGYKAVYQATREEQDLDAVLKDVSGLVVVAGGDGSVRAVARRLIGRQVPIAILPVGTANNIAVTLGITGSLPDLIAGLKSPRPVPFDVGHLNLPCGDEYFFEAFGFGVYADGLAAYEPEKGQSFLRSLTAAIQTLTNFQARPCSIQLDGKDISGQYWMVEALNTKIFGPWLKAAPQADPSDGLLEVICVQEKNRDSVLAYLLALLQERLEELPSVEVLRGRCLEIDWDGFTLNADAEVYSKPSEPAQDGGELPDPAWKWPLKVEVMQGAVEFWLPEIDHW